MATEIKYQQAPRGIALTPGGTQVTALGCLSVPVAQTDYQTVVIQDVPQHDNTRGPVAYYSRPVQAPIYPV